MHVAMPIVSAACSLIGISR